MKKLFLSLVLLFVFISPTFAQEDVEEFVYKARISSINEVECAQYLDEVYGCYTYGVFIDDLEREVETIVSIFEYGESRFKIGDSVYVSSIDVDNGDWHISGFARESTIFLIVLIFSVVAVVIGGKRGVASLLSLGVTFVLLYLFAIPQMVSGGNVLVIGVLSVVFSMLCSMYVAHGFNKKTTISVVSTLFGVLLVGLVAMFFISIARLDGLGSDDAFSLLSVTGGSINMLDVYFISILIGAMGVLDDVIVSQVASVYELFDANSSLSVGELYNRAMVIGKEHMSSMVNTLFVAYAGSSLFLVMLLSFNGSGMSNVLRADSVVEEIVRTLAASIGILLVVPVSTYLAARMVKGLSK